MDKINFRFLNYKHYNAFKNDLDSGKIKDESIVFIQDKLCIWARGKEYGCDGPYTAGVLDNILTFKNVNDSTIFTFSQGDGTITVTDANGNESSVKYALESDLQTAMSNAASKGDVDALKEWKDHINGVLDDYALEGDLAKVAYTGNYQDLSDTPIIPTTDQQLNPESTRPISNSAVCAALGDKANSSELDSYVQKGTYNADMDKKQDKLTAGDGISIYKDNSTKLLMIKSTVDTSVYVIVTSLPDPAEADPNKIYIEEINNGDGTYRYRLSRLRNGQWVSFDMAAPSVDLSDYLTKEFAEETYQEKIDDYLTSADLIPYALDSRVDDAFAKFGEYTTTAVLEENYQLKRNDFVFLSELEKYVKKADVYTPTMGLWGSDGSGDGGEYVITPVQAQIVIDDFLSLASSNPVENATITAELNKKADASALNNYALKTELNSKLDTSALANYDYATKTELQTGLSTKQNTLIPVTGGGISIVNDRISCTIDTTVFIFVKDQLPSASEANANKIYILETVSQNDERSYSQWKYDTDIDDWVRIGAMDAPSISLEDYLSKEEAVAGYQPIGNYITSGQLAQTLLGYQLAGNYQEAGDYVTTEDLLGYDYADNTTLQVFKQYINNKILGYQPAGNYAIPGDITDAVDDVKEWVESNFVKKIHVYTPNSSNWNPGDDQNGGGTGGDVTIINQVTVDDRFIQNSPNPVESKVIQQALNQKQNALTAGTGIQIDNNTNTISCTVDANVYVMVTQLPDSNRNPNKIYILETIQDGEYTYSQYRWDSDQTRWVEIGTMSPDVDLSDYLKSSDAEGIYQKKADMSSYITSSEVSLQYVDKPTFNLFRQTLNNNQGYSNLMTLTVLDYATLAEHDLIDENTYYFTYEEEETEWQFNGTFPITLT